MALVPIEITNGPSHFELMLALFDPWPNVNSGRDYGRDVVFSLRTSTGRKLSLWTMIQGMSNESFEDNCVPNRWRIQGVIVTTDNNTIREVEPHDHSLKVWFENRPYEATYNPETKKGELLIDIPEVQV